MPLALVGTVARPANVPLGPDVGARKVTLTPPTGLPAMSFTCACSNEGNGCDTGMACGAPLKTVMLAAAPAVIWNGLLSTGACCEEIARRRLMPISAIFKSLNVAMPVLSVNCTSVPSSVPVPAESDSTMDTPATFTGFPDPSRTCTVTGGVMTCPAAVLLGCCTKTRELAPTGRLVSENTTMGEPVTAVEDATTPKLPAML